MCDGREEEGHDDVFVSAAVEGRAWAAPGEEASAAGRKWAGGRKARQHRYARPERGQPMRRVTYDASGRGAL